MKTFIGFFFFGVLFCVSGCAPAADGGKTDSPLPKSHEGVLLTSDPHPLLNHFGALEATQPVAGTVVGGQLRLSFSPYEDVSTVKIAPVNHCTLRSGKAPLFLLSTHVFSLDHPSGAEKVIFHGEFLDGRRVDWLWVSGDNQLVLEGVLREDWTGEGTYTGRLDGTSVRGDWKLSWGW